MSKPSPPSERGKLLAAENRKKLCMWQGVGLGSTLIEPIRQRGKLNFFEHFLTIKLGAGKATSIPSQNLKILSQIN